MGKISWNGVILGGILAGIIIDVVEYVLHGVVLNAHWRQAMQDLDRPLQETVGSMVFYVLLGVVTVSWRYGCTPPSDHATEPDRKPPWRQALACGC